MLRAAKSAGQLPADLVAQMSAGGLVPDKVVIGLIDAADHRGGRGKGFLLDGFPRTVPQAAGARRPPVRREARGSTRVLALDVPRDAPHRACQSCAGPTNALDRSTT